jgi:hypothetical protein
VEPELQLEHSREPSKFEYFPTGQSMHVSLQGIFKTKVDLYLPAGQYTHGPEKHPVAL